MNPSEMQVWAVVALLCVTVSAVQKRYDGYQVLSMKPSSLRQFKAIRSLSLQFDMWKKPRDLNDRADVMVPPERKRDIRNFLRKNKIKFSVRNRNIQKTINRENVMLRRQEGGMDWYNYHSLQVIYDWLEDMASNYSDKVKLVNIGKSYANNDIKGLEIRFGSKLPGVVLEGGIHGREWISPATTTWIVNEILHSPPDSSVRHFNYVFFPVTNPDGYIHSWLIDRLWRKTRTPYFYPFQYDCAGADPNRNFDVKWGDTDGCSPYPCEEDYCGPYVFSEKSTKHYSDYLLKIHKSMRLDLYFSFHSYGQNYLYPYGFTDNPPPHIHMWDKMGKAAAAALHAVHKKSLNWGQSSRMLYKTTGSSDDWAYVVLNVSVSGTFEMRDTGKYGFLLPPNEIIPNSEEYFAALKAILKLYVKRSSFCRS